MSLYLFHMPKHAPSLPLVTLQEGHCAGVIEKKKDAGGTQRLMLREASQRKKNPFYLALVQEAPTVLKRIAWHFVVDGCYFYAYI